jgi:hypothetical protein
MRVVEEGPTVAASDRASLGHPSRVNGGVDKRANHAWLVEVHQSDVQANITGGGHAAVRDPASVAGPEEQRQPDRRSDLSYAQDFLAAVSVPVVIAPEIPLRADGENAAAVLGHCTRLGVHSRFGHRACDKYRHCLCPDDERAVLSPERDRQLQIDNQR